MDNKTEAYAELSKLYSYRLELAKAIQIPFFGVFFLFEYEKVQFQIALLEYYLAIKP